MTHLRSNKARKRFVCRMITRAKPKQVYRIYRATEKAIHFKHKKKRY